MGDEQEDMCADTKPIQIDSNEHIKQVSRNADSSHKKSKTTTLTHNAAQNIQQIDNKSTVSD